MRRYVALYWAYGHGPWKPFHRAEFPKLLRPFNSMGACVEEVQARLARSAHYPVAVFLEKEDLDDPLLIIEQPAHRLSPLDRYPGVERIDYRAKFNHPLDMVVV